MTDYRQLLSDIKTRHNPENQYLVESRMFTGLPSDISDLQRYVYIAMMAVDENYTSKTKEAGQRVRAHLQDGGLTNVSYHYQGSVMTDTHIRGYSDIDLLVICEKYYSYDSVSVKTILESYNPNYTYSEVSKLRSVDNASPYTGNVYDDLRTIRVQSESILSRKYLKCDISHPKAIKITNQDLHRDVDIVTAGWYDDVNSIINDRSLTYRGIQVYDKIANIRCAADYPFLSIERINTKSANTGGRLKRMIRFLKNIKADSKQKINLSSFDINAICYDIDINTYKELHYLNLVTIVFLQLHKIAYDESYANRVTSVDGKEYIFRDSNKRQEVAAMLQNVYNIYTILKEQHLL